MVNSYPGNGVGFEKRGHSRLWKRDKKSDISCILNIRASWQVSGDKRHVTIKRYPASEEQM